MGASLALHHHMPYDVADGSADDVQALLAEIRGAQPTSARAVALGGGLGEASASEGLVAAAVDAPVAVSSG